MTELLIEVENESILSSLRKVLSSMDGVKVKRASRRKKTGLELALEDVKEGRVTEWNSVDEMFQITVENRHSF